MLFSPPCTLSTLFTFSSFSLSLNVITLFKRDNLLCPSLFLLVSPKVLTNCYCSQLSSGLSSDYCSLTSSPLPAPCCSTHLPSSVPGTLRTSFCPHTSSLPGMPFSLISACHSGFILNVNSTGLPCPPNLKQSSGHSITGPCSTFLPSTW